MMKFLPLNKRSKKEQRKYNNMQRGTWHEFRPVTRIVPSGKIYNRKRMKSSISYE